MAEDRENRNDGNAVDTTQERENDQQVRVKEPVQKLDPLFQENEAEKFHDRWTNIQSKFVESPPEALKEADELVADVLNNVTTGFHDRRTSLEKQWQAGNNASTEELRQALKRYRSFFDRLLSLKY